MEQQYLPKIMKKGNSDDFQTPIEALNPLLKYISKDWIIWESACGKGYLVNELTKRGYKVKASDIISGGDFFVYEPEKWDCLITNPPFSKKNEWIERCYELKKPFALLLPFSALETKRRQKQWSKGLQLIILNERLNFETPNMRKSHSWFATAWFTYKLNLPNDIIFDLTN